MKYAIKIIITALLFGCLAHMPYGYYQFIRWACCAGFIYLAYTEYKADKWFLVIPSIVCAILFNPVAPIYLQKEQWQMIDIITGSLLILWLIAEVILNVISKRKKIVQ